MDKIFEFIHKMIRITIFYPEVTKKLVISCGQSLSFPRMRQFRLRTIVFVGVK
jgi:hypothetical protein